VKRRREERGRKDGRGSGWEIEWRKRSCYGSGEKKEGGKEGKTVEGLGGR
jgi:hypothetical protein